MSSPEFSPVSNVETEGDLKSKVENCKSIEELINLLKDTPIIRGTSREYDGPEIATRILGYLAGKVPLESITRSSGIRSKLIEIKESQNK